MYLRDNVQTTSECCLLSFYGTMEPSKAYILFTNGSSRQIMLLIPEKTFRVFVCRLICKDSMPTSHYEK